MSIETNLKTILSQIHSPARLVAVSKTHPVELIQEAYNTGQRIFGESKAQDVSAKYEQLPKDIQWHFIGHLQSNKIKYIAPFVELIHSVDSFNLLIQINKEAVKNNRVINCLLQIHIAQEETKYGFDLEEIIQMLESADYKSLRNICICGVMGMATLTENDEQIRTEFQQLKKYFQQLKNDYFADENSFTEISMGMSDDFKLAIDEGSTLVRIGSAIFGHRNYNL